ncbi:MAG TPA: YcbK family protein [Candidatus Binataceae bacterium]|nr:YcbK family protein [Candidatus Binataceae bacterium]
MGNENSSPALISRRKLLKIGLIAAAPVLIPGAAMAAYHVIPKRSRSLSFYNLHTGESLKTTYFANGEYIPGALREIDFILRDWRQHEVKAMDPALLDLLVGIHHRLGTSQPFQIISGYRTAKTNALLRASSEGVAAHSLHIDGKAIDICVEGRSLANVRRAAISMFGGGVGYYPRTGFVHVDTGRLRYW